MFMFLSFAALAAASIIVFAALAAGIAAALLALPRRSHRHIRTASAHLH